MVACSTRLIGFMHFFTWFDRLATCSKCHFILFILIFALGRLWFHGFTVAHSYYPQNWFVVFVWIVRGSTETFISVVMRLVWLVNVGCSTPTYISYHFLSRIIQINFHLIVLHHFVFPTSSECAWEGWQNFFLYVAIMILGVCFIILFFWSSHSVFFFSHQINL
jgi:hypothetical protein